MSMFARVYRMLGGKVYPCSVGGKPHNHYYDYGVNDCIMEHCSHPEESIGVILDDDDNSYICVACGKVMSNE